MSDMTAYLMAAAQLEGKIQDFLDPRLSGERDLVIRGDGVALIVFRGNVVRDPRETEWDKWGFAGETVIHAFRVLRSTGANNHRGFWTAPSLRQFNWRIYES